MKRLYFTIFLCSVLWVTCARSQGISRPEIDFLVIDTRWSLSELNKYMSGKCSKPIANYDTSGVLWSVNYDSVYCGGMLGELYGEQIDSGIYILFSSPIYLGRRLTLPDASNCIDDGYLPSREKYDELKKKYGRSYKRKSTTEVDRGEGSTFDNGRNSLELRYYKVRPTKGEIVLIHLH